MKNALIRTFLTIAFFSCTHAVNAQALIALVFGKKLTSERVKMGIELGLQETSISGATPWRPRSSFAIGAYTDVQLGKTGGPWSMTFYCLFKSSKGVNGLSADERITTKPDTVIGDDINRKMTYFEILPFICYRLNDEWYIGAGPDIAYCTYGEDNFVAKDDDADLTYKIKTRDQINKFDIGMGAGVQYRMFHGRGLKISLFYSRGFLNIYNVNNKTGYNNTLHIGVGIPVGG